MFPLTGARCAVAGSTHLDLSRDTYDEQWLAASFLAENDVFAGQAADIKQALRGSPHSNFIVQAPEMTLNYLPAADIGFQLSNKQHIVTLNFSIFYMV